MRRKALRSRYKPIPEVVSYRKKHDKCEITGMWPAQVHHIDHNRNNNAKSNLFSLHFYKHTGDGGVHTINEIEWIESNELTDHRKWKPRYEKLLKKREYTEEIKKLGNLT